MCWLVFLDWVQIISHVHFFDVRWVELDLNQLFDEFSVLELNLDVVPDRWEGFFGFYFLFLLSVQRLAFLDL